MALLDTAAVTLGNLLAKSAGDAITEKMQSTRAKTNLDEMANSYENIINGLVQDRIDAISVAQAYKTEVDRVEITDDDITHLHKTIEELVNILGKDDANLKAIAGQINVLISVDTLKTVQLLGFNYKAAIGEPLTKVCAQMIEAKLGVVNTPGNQNEQPSVANETTED